MRNEEPSVGHGRGPQERTIPLSLAELGVHLSAVIINFLIKQYLEESGREHKKDGNITEAKAPF